MICFRRATLVLCVAGAFAMSANPPSLAQQSTPSSPPVVRQPYNIVAFGAFRLLILSGDFSPKVALAEALSNRPTTGVGAVAEAR